MTCVTVHHQAMPTADGHVAVMRIGCVLEDAETVTTSRFCITLTPDEARRMARLMASVIRDTHAHFLKEDGDDVVDVWCKPYEVSLMTWIHKDGEQVCEAINCYRSGGDGWSWDFAQALEEAADKAEEGSE